MKITALVVAEYENNSRSIQCCGSGSGRIRNFWPDPDLDPEKIVSDPDPGSPDPKWNEN